MPAWGNTLALLGVLLFFVFCVWSTFRFAQDRWQRAFFILVSLLLAFVFVQLILLFGGEHVSEVWVKDERMENGVLIVECHNEEGDLIDCPSDDP
jgi:uncharacterized protein YpmS